MYSETYGQNLKVNLRSSYGSGSIQWDVNPSWTFGELKSRLHDSRIANKNQYYFESDNKIMNDNWTLSSAGVCENAFINMTPRKMININVVKDGDVNIESKVSKDYLISDLKANIANVYQMDADSIELKIGNKVCDDENKMLGDVGVTDGSVLTVVENDKVNIKVRYLSQEVSTVVDKSITVGSLKETLSETMEIPKEELSLFKNGRELSNDYLNLKSAGITKDDTLSLTSPIYGGHF